MAKSSNPNREVAEAVIAALSTCPQAADWATQDPDQLTVRDISGKGGSKTYHVSVADHHKSDSDKDSASSSASSTPPPAQGSPVPNEVCYHKIRGEGLGVQARLEVSQSILSAQGLAPTRLVTLEGGWVETFSATRPKSKSCQEDCVTHARLLAKIHMVPTEWFESHRAAVYESNPRLREANIPLNSHLWIYSARGALPGANVQVPTFPEDDQVPSLTERSSAFWPAETFQAYADLGAIMPQHPAAKRLATLHGDFHAGNVLRLAKSEGGDGKEVETDAIACDFEMTCAGAAVWDLSYMCANHCWDSTCRHLFLRTYLKEMGDEETLANAASYEDFLTDISLGMFATWAAGSKLIAWCIRDLPAATMSSPIGELALVKNFAQEFRKSPFLQQQAKLKRQGAVAVFKETRNSTLMRVAAVRTDHHVTKATAHCAGYPCRDVTEVVRSLFVLDDGTFQLRKALFTNHFGFSGSNGQVIPAEGLEIVIKDGTSATYTATDRFSWKDGLPLPAKTQPSPIVPGAVYELAPKKYADLRLEVAAPAPPVDEEAVALVMGMGFEDKAAVVHALRCAFGNADRAVEFMFNGIPASAEAQVAAQHRNGAHIQLCEKAEDATQPLPLQQLWRAQPRGNDDGSWCLIPLCARKLALDTTGGCHNAVHLWDRHHHNENQFFFIYPSEKEEGETQSEDVMTVENVKFAGSALGVRSKGTAAAGTQATLLESHKSSWRFIRVKHAVEDEEADEEPEGGEEEE